MRSKPPTKFEALLVAAMVSNCGGTVNIGGESSQRKKQKEASSSNDDQLASDPQVVTGAYLACEVSLTDTADVPQPERAVGCNVMTATGKPIKTAANQKLDFSVNVPSGKIAPRAQNTSTGYQALFSIAKTQLANASYNAKLTQDDNLIKEYTAEIKDPLALFSLVENPGGIWKPLDNGRSNISGAFTSNLAETLVIPFATSPNCSASPDAYCNEYGELSGKSPATYDAVNDCAGPFAASLVSAMSGAFKDGPKPSTNPETISGNACANPKLDPAGSRQLKYFSHGKNCSVAIITDYVNGKHSNPKTLVYKNSQLPFPPDIMEKRFSVMACGNKR